MNITRRAVAGGGLAGLAAALAACQKEAGALAKGTAPSEVPSDSPLLDEETLDFWMTKARRPVEDYELGHDVKSASTPAFVYYGGPGQFQLASSSTLPPLPDKGNVSAMLRVERFRPAKNELAGLKNLQQGSLRIDMQQTTPLPNLAEALAWSAVAAFVPGADGKLPGLQQLSFDPGTAWGRLQSVPLPEGLGFWTWNFFVQRKESTWSRLFNFLKDAAPAVAPFLSLPAIAVSALTQVDRVLGYLQATDRTEWLLKSPAVAIYGTKVAQEKVGGNGIGLRTGRYLVIPQHQLASFSQKSSNAELTNEGLVVPTGTKDLEAFAEAEKFAADVTYLSVYVTTSVS